MAKGSSIKDKARELKRLGVISYDLRHKLNFGQRMAIEKSYQKFGAYIEKPELFAAPVVRQKSAESLRRSGYLVTPRGRAIIPLRGAESARISRIGADGVIEFEKPGEHRAVILADRQQFLAKLKKLTGKKLARNQMVTVQIGDRNPFKTAYTSFAQLYFYLENDFEPNDEGTDLDDLFPQMSIVTITGPAQQRKKSPASKSPTKGTPVKTRGRK